MTEDDFDPAKAIREARQQWEVEATQEQCAQAQQQTLDDKITEAVRDLLLYADGQLESLRNPVISEFILAEMIWGPKPGRRGWRKQKPQIVRREHQTHYYGSWCSYSPGSAVVGGAGVRVCGVSA